MANHVTSVSLATKLDGLWKEENFRKSLSGIVMQILGKGFALLAIVLLTRNLSTENFGAFAYARSWVLVLGPIATLGLGYASYKFLSQYFVTKDYAAANGYVGLAILVSVVLSAIMIATEMITRRYGVLGDGTLYGAAMAVSFWSIPAMALVLILRFVGQNLGQVGISFVPVTLQPALQCGLILIVLFTVGLDLEGALYTFLISNYLSLLVAIIVLWGIWKTKVGFTRPKLHVSQWMTVSVPLAISSIAMVINQQADLLIVGSLLGPKEAGLYTIAMSLSLLISMVALSVSATFVPQIARAFTANDMSAAQVIIRKSSVYFFLPALAGVMFFVVLGRPMLGVFGPQYEAAFYVLCFLSISELCVAASEPSGHILNVAGRQNANTVIVICGAILNIGLNLVFVPRWGIEGAAAATLISTVVWTGLRVYLVHRHFGLWSGIYGRIPDLAGRAR